MNLNYWNWKKLTGMVILLYCPQVVLAQNDFAIQVRDQLIETASTLKVGNNYHLTRDPVVNGIKRGDTKKHALTLDAGISYVIIGVCDNNCDDIDLRLYDEEGNEVSYDMAPDNTPLIRITSQPQATKFKLEVIMKNCSASACDYGVGIFEQQAEELSKLDKISPEQVVRDYYNNLDKGRVDAALGKWKFSSKSQERRIRGLAEGIEWFKLNHIELMNASSKSATVSAEVSGKKKGQPSGRWSVTIDLEKISGEWKITNIKAR